MRNSAVKHNYITQYKKSKNKMKIFLICFFLKITIINDIISVIRNKEYL